MRRVRKCANGALKSTCSGVGEHGQREPVSQCPCRLLQCMFIMGVGPLWGLGLCVTQCAGQCSGVALLNKLALCIAEAGG